MGFLIGAAATAVLLPTAIAAQTPGDLPDGLEDLELDSTGVELPLDGAEPGSSEPDLRPLAQDGSLLSLAGGRRLMREGRSAAASQSYAVAVSKFQDARQVFNQLSNFYRRLSDSFVGIDGRIAEQHRDLALETAEMRDQATYQLALVHRAEGQPDLAVPLLIQIIQSQDPTRDLGERAYRQLFELGFVDTAFPRNQADDSATTTPASALEN
ncbi:MAG: hypothetical protein AAF289_22030 [Cyanobacteria bacterium P01_A01_bin.135]